MEALDSNDVPLLYMCILTLCGKYQENISAIRYPFDRSLQSRETKGNVIKEVAHVTTYIMVDLTLLRSTQTISCVSTVNCDSLSGASCVCEWKLERNSSYVDERHYNMRKKQLRNVFPFLSLDILVLKWKDYHSNLSCSTPSTSQQFKLNINSLSDGLLQTKQ